MGGAVDITLRCIGRGCLRNVQAMRASGPGPVPQNQGQATRRALPAVTSPARKRHHTHPAASASHKPQLDTPVGQRLGQSLELIMRRATGPRARTSGETNV